MVRMFTWDDEAPWSSECMASGACSSWSTMKRKPRTARRRAPMSGRNMALRKHMMSCSLTALCSLHNGQMASMSPRATFSSKKGTRSTSACMATWLKCLCQSSGLTKTYMDHIAAVMPRITPSSTTTGSGPGQLAHAQEGRASASMASIDLPLSPSAWPGTD